jgi:exosortase/archaeosortase family protein
VRTDTAHAPIAARSFMLWSVAWSLGFFALLRLSWTEAHLLLPLIRAQGRVATGLFGVPALPVEVTLACSGADALALCLAAVVAYPVRWRSRVACAAGGAALLLGLNTIRIGTLGRAASSSAWFEALHIYVWPAALTLAIVGYVFTWMHVADRGPQPAAAVIRAHGFVPGAPAHAWRRFILLTVVFVLAFAIASPLYLESAAVLALATFVARAAAATLSAIGVAAHASANVLWVPHGGFLVSQECISTPLLPVYAAAVCAFGRSWSGRLLGLLAAVPIFVALGVVRLLVVALPDVLDSPLFLVHAFYQLLLAAVVVCVAAIWRHGRRAAPGRALAGAAAGVVFALLPGPLYTQAILYAASPPQEDPQGAIGLLPVFQMGLYVALWIAGSANPSWRRVLAGAALLAASEVAGLLALQAFVDRTGLTLQVRDIRGWAIVGPVLVFALVTNIARPRR